MQENGIRMLCVPPLIFVFGISLAASSVTGYLIRRLPSSLACLALHWALLALLCPYAVLRTSFPQPWTALHGRAENLKIGQVEH